MHKHLMLTALLLGRTAAPRGEKIDKNLTPFWVADYTSLQLHGAGAPINWALFANVSYGTAGQRFVPSGSPVMLVAGKIGPADGSSETLLMMSNAQEGSASDSISGYGLVTGGNIYEKYLPTATGNPAQLPAAVRAAVSPRLRLQ